MRPLFSKHWTWAEVRADIAEDLKFKLRVLAWCFGVMTLIAVLALALERA